MHGLVLILIKKRYNLKQYKPEKKQQTFFICDWVEKSIKAFERIYVQKR